MSKKPKKSPVESSIVEPSSEAASKPGETPPRASVEAVDEPRRPYVDLDAVYTLALDAADDAVIEVPARAVRQLVEAVLIVTAQKREMGRGFAEVLQLAADEPLRGMDLDAALRRVREGSRP